MSQEAESAHTVVAPRLENAVILVTGVMAAGKSTIAQLLAESFPRAVHIRGDLFRRFIVAGRIEPTPAMSPEALGQLLLRYRLAAACADAYAQAGFVAVVQDIIVGELLTDVIKMFTTPDLFLVVLDPDASAVTARERSRIKTGYVDGWSAASLVTEFRATTPRVGLWLDTTALDPQQSARAILGRLEQARTRHR